MFDQNTKVLVVDDMASMRELMIKSLKQIGFDRLTEACSAAQAWQLMLEADPPFGLVFSAWNLPNSDSLDLLKRTRADQNYADIPFLVVTPESDEVTKKKVPAKLREVSGYLTKPFTLAKLEKTLAEAYQKHTSRSS